MSSADAPPAGAPLPPAEAWLRLSDAVVAGIHHTLNNRVAALRAVAQVLEMEVPPGHPLQRSLGVEMERLQETVRVLSLVPRHRTAPAEPVQVADLLRDAHCLYREHHDLRDVPFAVEGAEDVLPVWGEPSALTHALLVLLGVVGRRAAGQAGAGIRARCTGDRSFVRVEVGLDGGGAAGGPGEAAALAGVEPGAAAVLLGRWGGEVEEGEGGAVAAVLPTLLEARRREGR